MSSVCPISESAYFPASSFTNPAFLSSRRPLLTRNSVCPVLAATSSGVNSASFNAFKVVIPVVGFPSGDTQGILLSFWDFFGAQIPVFAGVAFF